MVVCFWLKFHIINGSSDVCLVLLHGSDSLFFINGSSGVCMVLLWCCYGSVSLFLTQVSYHQRFQWCVFDVALKFGQFVFQFEKSIAIWKVWQHFTIKLPYTLFRMMFLWWWYVATGTAMIDRKLEICCCPRIIVYTDTESPISWPPWRSKTRYSTG